MKLAEALIERADLRKRIDQMAERLKRNAKVQEGDEPAEDPAELLDELEILSAQLEGLVQRINRTNVMTHLPDGDISLSDALARRSVLARKRKIYADLAAAASIRQDVYSRSEVRFESTVDVKEIQDTADGLARDYRELDTKIQEMNWKQDLLE